MKTVPAGALMLALLSLAVAAWAAASPEPLAPGTTESLAWTAAATSVNLALGKGIKASSPQASLPTTALPGRAIDGNPRTEWAVAAGAAILQLELPAPALVNGISLVRDISTEHPWESCLGAEFEVETSPDGQTWQSGASSRQHGQWRVTHWAVLFPEQETRFVRFRAIRGNARLGEFGVFRADLSQAAKWGWAVPSAAWRAPLVTRARCAEGWQAPVNLALARGSVPGVVLARSVTVVSAGAPCPSLYVPGDAARPEEGVLYWREAETSRGPRWLYFNTGTEAAAEPPAAEGTWTAAGLQVRGLVLKSAQPARPLWGGELGWVLPPSRDGAELALSTVWDNCIRSKALVATIEVKGAAGQPLAANLQLALEQGSRALSLHLEPLHLRPGATDKREVTFDLAKCASGDYVLVASLFRAGDGVLLAEKRRPLYVAPVSHLGMTFGIYGVPYWAGDAGYAASVQTAADAGFTEVMGQYWGGGYCFLADRALRHGLLWNPTIEPIYNHNALADQDPEAACTGPDGKRVEWHPSTCYTHPEVAKRTEADVEKWLREIVTAPGFAGRIEVDDDVHLAPEGCYNASCRDLFREVTGREVPQPQAGSPNQPHDMPAPGLIADDQPWLQWALFRCSHIRGNLAKIYMRAKQRVNPDIQMGAIRGHMQFPFYTPHSGEYPPLFDALYDAPGSYAYLYWVRQMQDYIAHGALAQMGSRGKGPWILGDFALWPAWILEKGGDGRWELALMKSLQEAQTNGNLYPPGALNRQVWCMLAGGFKVINMFTLPEGGARNDVTGTEDHRLLQTWGARARAYGHLMTALQEPLRPVVILTSISTSAFEEGVGLTHSGITAGVLKDCLREHVPADMIAEEEILAGGLSGRKILLLPDLRWLRRGVNAAIEKWAAQGGTVIAETGAPLQPAGSRAVPRPAMAAAAGVALAPAGRLQCDNPLVLSREFDCDGVRYYYLVNVFSDRWSAGLANDPWVAGDNSTFTELYTPRAQVAHLRLPAGLTTGWDVFGHRAYAADADGVLTLTVPGDDGLLLALYPQRPERLALKVPAAVKGGGEVTVDVTLRDSDGKPFRGGVPVQVTVTDPNGRDSEYSRYALATGGSVHLAFRTAWNDVSGKWRVTVRSLVGATQAAADFRLAQ